MLYAPFFALTRLFKQDIFVVLPIVVIVEGHDTTHEWVTYIRRVSFNTVIGPIHGNHY